MDTQAGFRGTDLHRLAGARLLEAHRRSRSPEELGQINSTGFLTTYWLPQAKIVIPNGVTRFLPPRLWAARDAVRDLLLLFGLQGLSADYFENALLDLLRNQG